MTDSRAGRIEMELVDGRVIDLSGLSADDAVARIVALGITPADIKETRHYVDLGLARPQEDRVVLKVGDVVRVGHTCLGNPAGSTAVVVEVYDRHRLRLGSGIGVTLLFANGAHDGFSPDDQLLFGVERLGHRPTLAHYRFMSASRLFVDWKSKLFDEVWREWV